MLQVKGASARVHWLYLPDSYDEWVPATATAGVADPPHRPPRGPWHVYARWLTDSEKYNEWMNPADYETPEAAEEAKRKRETGDAGEDSRRKVGTQANKRLAAAATIGCIAVYRACWLVGVAAGLLIALCTGQ